MGVKCHWPGCRKEAQPGDWACHSHMARLPQDLRRLVSKVMQVEDFNRPTRSTQFTKATMTAHRYILANQLAMPVNQTLLRKK